ncbi:uncharacterized protein [Drosophila kikkawai]|uniref:Uncharacterized protein n=1 Tax=Drosophila kikkawai TaxID=30033 RepID=A0A6P4HP82_DROKI|nr:uncharacterized protein LOC108071416 isoform X2 [Drosophila kikkawai]
MLQFRIFILLMLFAEGFMLLKKNYEVRFISVDYTGGTDYIDVSKIRFLGRERLANGTVEMKKDFSDELYSVSAESFIDPNGDGNYKKLPMFIPRQPICKAMESNWKYLDASLKYGVNSDFPAHLHPCPIPKGLYYVKNVSPKTDDWPVIMPRGFLKAVMTLYDEDKVAGTFEVVVQISDLS